MTAKTPTGPALAALLVPLLSQAFWPSAALAQRNDPGLRANCAGDYFRYCVGLAPDGPEIRACFRRNLPRLSAGCRGAIRDYDRRTGRPSLPEEEDE